MPTSASWKTATGGSFNVAANWSTGAVPNASTQAVIAASGAAYTVTSAVTNTVDYLTIGADATLDVTGGNFTIYSAVNTYSDADNDGTIRIDAGSLTFGKAGSPSTSSSQLRNVGTVQIGSGTAKASLIFAAPFANIVDGGTVTMAGNAVIAGGTSAVTFENHDNLIQGAGKIGSATLTLRNAKAGVINANTAAALTIDTGANVVYNTGTIETTGAGGLTIASSMDQHGLLLAAGTGALTISGAEIEGSGNIAATAAGASIRLSGTTLDFGGFLSSVADSTIVSLAGKTNSISAIIRNAGTFTVQAGSTLRLNADVQNSSRFEMSAAGTTKATLKIYDDGATISGTGQVVLSNNANNLIVADGAATYLVNKSTIVGAGTIGDGNLIVENLTGGVLDANGSVAMTLVGANAAAGDLLYNAGLMQATGTGGLVITGAMSNAGTIESDSTGALTFKTASIKYGGGIVRTTQAGASIVLNNASLHGGTLTLVSGSTLTAVAGTVDALTTGVDNAGSLHVGNGATLTAGQQWTNSGTLYLDGTSAATALAVNGYLGLDGGGTVELAAKGTIRSNGAAATFRNLDNLIEGAGTIGDANLVFKNRNGGVVNATKTGGITIDTGANAIINSGTIRSSTASGVTLKSDLQNFGTLYAAAGTIDAMGNVTQAGTATIAGTATMRFEHHVESDVVFAAGSKGTLRLDSSATDTYYGFVQGFTGQTKIDLSDIAFVTTGAGVTTLSYNGGAHSGLLTVRQGEAASTIAMKGAFTAADFHIASDQHGGTLVT